MNNRALYTYVLCRPPNHAPTIDLEIFVAKIFSYLIYLLLPFLKKKRNNKLKNRQTETGAHYKTLYTCTLAYSHQLNEHKTTHQ